MMTEKKVIDIRPMGPIMTVIRSSSHTNGASLDLEWEVPPGLNMELEPFYHKHPNAIETYEILEGEMEFFVNDNWVTAKKGDKLTVPKGVTHMFRNPTNQVVKVYNTHQPALRMQEFFEDGERFLLRMTNDRKKEFKLDFKAKLHMSVVLNKYRSEIIGVRPPDFALRILGFIGKWIGIKS
jgi:mannose-6-phosphate isomerase-like protein (cupin superfamily)